MKGNIGDWSEIYVFLKLLSEGRLNAADANLNAIPNIYYPIIKIIREENNLLNKKKVTIQREYTTNGDINVFDGGTNDLLLTLPIADFIQKSQELFNELKIAKGLSFSLPLIEDFLNSIDVKSIKAKSTDKSDIKVVVHDLRTGLKPKLGFSIKSLLGGKSTLFNAGPGTNFIFKIKNSNHLSLNISKINTDTLSQSKIKKSDRKISLRINEIENLKFKIQFEKIQSDNLYLNLVLIDSQLPEILANLIYNFYKTGKSNVKQLLEEINQQNPLQFDQSRNHPFYEYKIKNFLTEIALGMTPEEMWNGKYDATGGIIIVKKSGDLVCYHIYNKNEFQEYLLSNTFLEQPATSEDDNNPGFADVLKKKPYKFGWIYEENGNFYIKLNLQIRFK
jgi:hypothetical protein